MKTNTLAMVVLLLAAASAMADGLPVAKITGPKESPPGELVILDASQSQGLGYLWLLVNSQKSFLPVDNGLKCVFSTGTPGDYAFVLIVSGTNPNGGPAAATAQHTLHVTGNTPEPPIPTPGPTPNPTPGPVVKTATRAMIVMESADRTPEQARLIQQIRNSKAVSAKVTILDPQAEDQDNQTAKAVVAALQLLGSKPLPRVFGLTDAGSLVCDGELPESLDALRALLESWGIQ
jgi:hypothetical protein